MASITIRWKIPADVSAVPNTAHTITVYRSTNGEDGDYSSIGTTSAGGGNTVKTYTDSSGDESYFYYVTYTASGGSEGDRVLAIQTPTVREQRLSEQIYDHVPEILRARLDSDMIDIRRAMKNALASVNAYSPVTSYTYHNMPDRFETAIVVLTLALLYMEKQLQVSIRDYSYGATGVNLTVDRNSKFASTITNLTTQVNKLLEFTKHGDWETSPIGLGSESVGTPMGRVYGIVFNTSV